jgi:hypothetical protein
VLLGKLQLPAVLEPDVWVPASGRVGRAGRARTISTHAFVREAFVGCVFLVLVLQLPWVCTHMTLRTAMRATTRALSGSSTTMWCSRRSK